MGRPPVQIHNLGSLLLQSQHLCVSTLPLLFFHPKLMNGLNDFKLLYSRLSHRDHNPPYPRKPAGLTFFALPNNLERTAPHYRYHFPR